MKLLRVEVERFRGIRHLKWEVGGHFVCLIGPGDSTKTSILDAIELALSPRWAVTFDDTDFFDACTDQPLMITVTVGDLPEELKSEAKYGFCARGWSPTAELHDEPADGDEIVLSIRLRVDASLEPAWTVVNDRDTDGTRISAKDRERFGCARLGNFLDRNFAWGRGSVLSRLTGETESIVGIIAAAGRAARAAVATLGEDKLAELRAAAGRAGRAGAECGVAPKATYRPHLDVDAVSGGSGSVSLHDGEVPLRRAGLGTRRLLAVAMQREVAKAGGLTLIDEIEYGLEPHRIRRLLQVLQRPPESPRATHVLMTTHAPVVLEELAANQLRIVRCNEGRTEVREVPADLQRIIRKTSEAFLARKVLICEGRTELGLCRRLDRCWAETGPSFSLAGVALADGGGREAPKVAQALAQLGYDTALLGDSDEPLDPDAAELESAGARVFLWEGGVCLEQRLALDLPWQGVADVVALAMDEYGEQSVRDAVQHDLGAQGARLAGKPEKWSEQVDESRLRIAIGLSAKGTKVGNRRGWFKRVDRAEKLASIVVRYHQAEGDLGDMGRTIDNLRAWVHEDG